jgi:hypothetical protein
MAIDKRLEIIRFVYSCDRIKKSNDNRPSIPKIVAVLSLPHIFKAVAIVIFLMLLIE